MELLEHNRARWGGWAVFPTNDDALAALSQHHEHLSRSYRLPFPPWDTPPTSSTRIGCTTSPGAGLDVPGCYGAADAQTAGGPCASP